MLASISNKIINQTYSIYQIPTSCLSQYSYLIESNKEIAIIDPMRDISFFTKCIEQNNFNLKYIFETHFHADFVSGHLELQRLYKSDIIFGNLQKEYPNFLKSQDNQIFQLGNVNIQAIHTPGHTLESACYLLNYQNKPSYIFTGDTIFLGEVGRPDLAVKSQEITKEDLALLLYSSIQNKILKLPKDVVIFPGHGAGSACGKNIQKGTHSTLDQQIKTNLYLSLTQDEFVKQTTIGLSQPLDYFMEDVKQNQQGYENLSEILKKAKQLNYQDILNQQQYQLIDMREPSSIVNNGFIKNSIYQNPRLGMNFVASLIPVNSNVILITEQNQHEENITRLTRVGYQNIIGYFSDIQQIEQVQKVQTIESEEFVQLNENTDILDVRNQGEYDSLHIQNSNHIVFGELPKKINQLDKNKKMYVLCAGGVRSYMACTYLMKNGFQNIISIKGGIDTLKKFNMKGLVAQECQMSKIEQTQCQKK